MSRVFVLDRSGSPLMPCHPARARKLLHKGRAVVVRLHPFTIRLRDRVGGETQEVGLKIDPGAKTTGLALVRADGEVLFLAEIEHRGARIRKAMQQRRNCRRRRRSANLRHRKKRFDNRRSGRKLPPSLQSRVDNVASWTERFRGLAPVTSIACEVVRFDTQALENPEIAGAEYQQGTLAGYEVRECLLEKWGRKCVYCDASGTPLQIDHVRPKAAGGSDRVSNLTLACRSCNQAKGAQPVETFLAGRPERLRQVLAQARAPLAAAAAVNATRRVLFEALKRTGLPVTGASGGRTKFNRTRLGIPKSHALDAACVGETPALKGWKQGVLAIRAMGRGSYARTRVNRFGFPVGHLMAAKSVKGFRTGDIVRATVPSGKRRGVHVDRVAVRRTGSFNVQTATGTVQGISHQHCRGVQRADGYGYHIDTSRKEEMTRMHGTRERPGRAGGHSAAMAAAPGKRAASGRRQPFPRRERRGIYGLMLTMAIVAVIILVMVGWAVTLREGARVSALQTTLTQAEAETRRLFSSFTNYSGDIDALVSSAMPTRARDGDTIVTPWGTTIEIGGGNTPGTQAAATVASTANRFWIQIDNLGEDACKKIAAAYQNNPGVLSVTDGTAAQTAADIDTPAEIESDCDGDTDLAIVFRG